MKFEKAEPLFISNLMNNPSNIAGLQVWSRTMKRLSFSMVVSLIVFLCLGLPCSGEEGVIRGCYKKDNGQLRIVKKATDCHSSEIPICWNKVGLQGSQGPAGPQGPQGPAGPAGSNGSASPPGPRVYDSNGQFIGILPNERDGFLAVLIPDFSKFILLSPDNGDVNPFYPSVYLYFDGDNCTGNSYLDTSLRYLIVKVDSKYVKADDVPSQCKDIRSIATPDWGSGRQCRAYTSSCMDAIPYKPITLPFNMPVALPLSFEY